MDNSLFTEVLYNPYIKNIRDNYKYLGAGYFGCAYLYDNKTYKITSDPDEIKICEHLKKNKYTYFNKVYDIKKVYYKNRLLGGIIIKEFISNVNTYKNRDFLTCLENFIYEKVDKEISVSFYHKKSWYIDLYYNENDAIDYLKKEGIEEPYLTMIKNKNNIKEEFDKLRKKLNITDLDSHAGNFGFNNDTYKLFDTSNM